MPFIVKYDEPKITRELYDAARKEINWDNGPPAGCLLHMTYFDEAGLHSMDIWESPAQIDAYLASRFDPALDKLGLSPAKPQIVELHAVAVSPFIEEFFIKAPAIA
jgi:hypothetical protein